MRKVAITVLAALLACGATGLAQEANAAAEAVNLSEGRGLGVGMQLDFPFGGLISARYWMEPSFGIEGILFVWGYEGDVEGAFTARTLYRIADAQVVDFYGVAGATIPFSSYAFGYAGPIVVSVAGGIEFGFRFAASLAWNIEFGFSVSSEGDFQMVFGTGIHFYFPRSEEPDSES